ncbi:hypothetical protein M8J76_016709 [Diaphorina citri]|nr:hypothetical protein M8J76_016709 [Diaphorina citri]
MLVRGATIHLHDKWGTTYEVEVSVVPTIVGHMRRAGCDAEVMRSVGMEYDLADHRYTTGEDDEFDLLLGNDHYSRFMYIRT